MAGTIIADTIQATSQQISLNVGNTTILTASSTGLTLIPTTNVNINVTNSNVTLTNANITTANITTANITGVATFSTGSAALPSITTAGDPDTGIYFPSANTIGFTRGGVEVGRFDSNSANANFQFNSGYGSVATAYGCRAWISFDANTATVRGSANISSITYIDVGRYNINFSTAMPDANYAVTTGVSKNGGGASGSNSVWASSAEGRSTGYFLIELWNLNNNYVNVSNVFAAVFR
jgi:hypothetical protein